jgi:S-methylmethionine-dependent homocysteine/selenocysteine methylase
MVNEGCNKYLCNFQEQIEWAVSRNVDYIIGETFPELEEVLLALNV